MIGAVPAVAVRHERRREKRNRRPSQLPLQAGRGGDYDPTPSPETHCFRDEIYNFVKVAGLHLIVGAVLFGVVLTVVGAVQMSPGAEAAHHRFLLLGCGVALLGGGLLSALLRYFCLNWLDKKMQDEYDAATAPPVAITHAHTTERVAQAQEKKSKLKAQASVTHEVDVLVKQPSATSDT